MKKLLTNANPFLLVLAPVVFAIVMGVSYQFEQKPTLQIENGVASVKEAKSLFVKSIGLVKTVASIATDNVW
ncbi:hypothetical protein FPZ43_06260 [Mucilaginibacter pallidiroseus]|uniref:Uncharacterized protein n=1 Tax=Mucilaginibacter pallidiroseus TaxID=2599295 RepID=A0A563UGY2_9SPHI|nr:hypothetical protein [Mucilaginibacter pallidiroseus]TWR30539.1 hypothetical protein FPZ43_06260 [Mucilaginibacter pallidiroseus]